MAGRNRFRLKPNDHVFANLIQACVYCRAQGRALQVNWAVVATLLGKEGGGGGLPQSCEAIQLRSSVIFGPGGARGHCPEQVPLGAGAIRKMN